MGKKVEKTWKVIPNIEKDVSEGEVEFGLQKATLLSLVENKKITVSQYDESIKLLEKKNKR